MKYRLEDLIDIKQFQSLQDRLNEIYCFPSSIIDNQGNILTATAWQEICTHFHRKNPECLEECIKSDQYIVDHIHEANPAVSYRCPHGLIDNATPIIIDGVHLGNFFTGQFFLEKPDPDFFRNQARKFGFDERAYLEAVDKVPIWSRAQLDNYLYFIKGLIEVITSIGLKNLREKETRKEIESNEIKFRTILQTTTDGFCMVSPEGRILLANDAYCQMSGYSRDELLGMGISDLDIDESATEVAGHLLSLAREGRCRFETRHRRKDGRIIDVEVSAQHQTSGSEYIVAFLRDITERKQAEQEKSALQAQLLQAQKMESIGTLAGGIAHDFNNILYPIIGNCEMLIDELAGDRDIRSKLQAILNSSMRAAELVKQILAFSRQQKVIKRPVKIQTIIKEALPLVRHTLPATIAVNLRIDDTCPPVTADSGQIHQVLLNLVTNAGHAMENTAGKLEIGLTVMAADHIRPPVPDLSPGRYVVLSVTDTGTGMDKTVAAKIFDPFYTTKGVGKGTGLGLSISYGIVREHGGLIHVISAPDQGSTFHVYLPVSEAVADETGPAPKTRIPRGTERILFVDDEFAIVDVVVPMLERLGYTVTARTTSLEALNDFRDDPDRFDIVITDMTMPVLTGTQLAGEIHRMRPAIPIILCTGFSEVMDEDKAAALGIQAFIMKPVVRDQLAVIIRKVLDVASGVNKRSASPDCFSSGG